MKPLKVYNVASGYTGCYYVRQLLPQIANGWSGDFKNMLALDNANKILNVKERVKEAYNSDIIVFHRCDDPKLLNCLKAFKQMGKKIVFDNDDTTKIENRSLVDAVGAKYEKNILEACSLADLVTASTSILAKEYLQYNGNVKVLPNCVAPNHYPEKKYNDTDKIRIGFVGSVAYKSDVGNIKPIIEWLCSLPNVQVVLYGFTKNEKALDLMKDEIEFWEKLPVEWQEWTPMNKYFETLNNLKLDIMVAPRADTYFNRCKSNVKYLEASMLEIAFIGQSFKTKDSPYDKDIIDGENGFLAQNNAEFKEKIEKLINDKELRQKLAQNAKEYVKNNYNIYDNSWKWEKCYRELLK